MHEPEYVTCIRVASDSILTTYRIDKENFNGLNVYKLDGGMSAEYAVEKSLSQFNREYKSNLEYRPGRRSFPCMEHFRFFGKIASIYNPTLRSGIRQRQRIGNYNHFHRNPCHTLFIGSAQKPRCYLFTSWFLPTLVEKYNPF